MFKTYTFYKRLNHVMRSSVSISITINAAMAKGM